MYDSKVDIYVSIILPVYNGERFIRETVDSILIQTHTNYELIIINDGSNDSTSQIIQSFKDSRIKYINNKDNMGLVYSLNLGLHTSVGKYIFRIDSDDICYRNRIKRQIQHMEKYSDVDVLGTLAQYFGSKKKKIRRLPLNGKHCKTHLFFNNCFVHSSMVFRKSFISSNNIKYNSKYIHAEDYALWSSIARENFTIKNLGVVLIKYRQHDSNITLVAEKNSQSRYNVIKEIYFNNIRPYSLDCVDDKIYQYHFWFSNYDRGGKLNGIQLRALFLFYNKLLKNKKFSRDYSNSYFRFYAFILLIMNIRYKNININIFKNIKHLL